MAKERPDCAQKHRCHHVLIRSERRFQQMQLLQPFLTLALAGCLFGEAVPLEFWGFALVLSVVVGLGRRMPVRRLLEKNA